ncbi:MAG: type II/IV secretion system ATPase subunit, partial [Euryarchaeota archaeon]|nr:type II/IV secretion system ATPase subunit [Euryarchaeota archaeon]
IFVVHKVLGMLETNIHFSTDEEIDDWMRVMSERIGRPVSDFRPIADGALPDGSRINIIYSREISRRGSSFTLRKFAAIPTSVTQLIKWGSISAEIGAYLWLCLENGMNVFVSGETASGKTTALNSIMPFVHSKGKVYSVEDTAEVTSPQAVWQQMITRETGPKNSQVDMFTLLKLALRSRPTYVIVGEIRGVEGSVAFQAMQAGNSVMATFHASSVKKLIQRLTGDPIRVPVTFIDNLHVVMILQAVYRQGVFLRRCVSVEEIEGYMEESKGVITRAVFQWDPLNDTYSFRGLNNSYILENLIAHKLGYADKKKIYVELELRAKVLRKMVELNITDYYKAKDIIWSFERGGVEGLPFSI